MAEETKKLTLDDPVDPETMQKLAELHDAKNKIANHLVDLENEKVRLLVACRQIDSERNRLFERVTTERGLPPGFPVTVEAESGKITANAKIPDEPPAPPPPAG